MHGICYTYVSHFSVGDGFSSGPKSPKGAILGSKGGGCGEELFRQKSRMGYDRYKESVDYDLGMKLFEQER